MSARRETGAARDFQPQLLYREVAPDLEGRHHLAPQERGKTTRMHILIETRQPNILYGKGAGENLQQKTLLHGGNSRLDKY